MNALELSRHLIALPSVTPDDAGCQTFMASQLQEYGFTPEWMNSGDVTNLWLKRGSGAPLFCFAGHTDVVPVGDQQKWLTPPFTPVEKDGYLYGRGAADMKTAIAAMMRACQRFVQDEPEHRGTIAFLITSDEEGPATDGTVQVIKQLQARDEKIDYCLVGEPSSTRAVGDTIKNGRRGSLNGKLTITGKQGHIAYPHLAVNPIHLAAEAMTRLLAIHWDEGNEFFPPTSFQISNINSGTGSTNVIPNTAELLFNFRFCTESTAESLKQRVHEVLDELGLNYNIDWNLSGQPFLTTPGNLVQAAQNAIRSVTGLETHLSTSGGTSDGRFIAPTGAQVVELGLLNATIHQVNEHVKIEDIYTLEEIYYQMLHELLA